MDDTSTPSDRFAEALWELLKPKLDAYLTEKGIAVGSKEQETRILLQPNKRRRLPGLSELIAIGALEVGQHLTHMNGMDIAVVVDDPDNRNKVRFGGKLQSLSEAATEAVFPNGVPPGKSRRTGYKYWGIKLDDDWISLHRYREAEEVQKLWREAKT